MSLEGMEYVGFWARVGANLIDYILILLVIVPALSLIYGAAYWASDQFAYAPMAILLNWVFPVVVIIAFWVAKQATPGKMVVSAKILEAETGNVPSVARYIGRYLGYIVSTVPLGLGLIWVAFDSRKQGWHDKLAGTVVVRQAGTKPEPAPAPVDG